MEFNHWFKTASEKDKNCPYLLFNVEKCESCGAEVMSPNSIYADRPMGTEKSPVLNDIIPKEDGSYGCYDCDE